MKNALDFLIHLKLNNNRNWFKANEKLYKTAKTEFESFVNELIPHLKKMDNSIDIDDAKPAMFRIFRDVRFSKNKEPYKNNFGAFIAKGGRKSPLAGYYVHMEVDRSFLGGGVYMPPSPQLKAIRTAIYNDPASYKKIIESKEFISCFGEVYGEKLKSAPRGFSKDFPDLDLIKNKHYAVTKEIENEFWLSGDPIAEAMNIFKKQLKFNEYLNRILEKVS